MLTHPLPVEAKAGRYPTYKLIGRRAILIRYPVTGPFGDCQISPVTISIRYYTQFPELIPGIRAGSQRVAQHSATYYYV